MAAIFRYLFVLLTILLVACQEQKQVETIVSDNPKPAKAEESREIDFEKITLSVMQGYNQEKYDKDYEIHRDSTFYYRLRERYCCPIKANYSGKLDSLSMSKVFALLDSFDFNSVKMDNAESEHSSYFSIVFLMRNGELKIKGDLDNEINKNIWELIEIIESQELRTIGNHKFKTAKDVLLPPPNYKPSQAFLDSL